MLFVQICMHIPLFACAKHMYSLLMTQPLRREHIIENQLKKSRLTKNHWLILDTEQRQRQLNSGYKKSYLNEDLFKKKLRGSRQGFQHS
jgi:hypothetical protein